MVQRKPPNNKFGIQADDDQDGKTRGPLDLRKKMKKSKSIKLIDNQQPPSIKTISMPPPTTSMVAPHAPSVNKTTCGSTPNYMKSTTSSDARKEQKLQASSPSKHVNTSTSNSNSFKSTSVSGGKLPRILTRASSFKVARKLTKTPSFKSKGAKTQSSRVVLSTDMDVRRPTCSSTMKDSKFPTYLTLNPGGSIVEGTSVLKVCPYTYCSLNGHHKSPLPPLKCFLKARRCSMKIQKSSKFDKLHDNELIQTEDMSRNKDDECSQTNFFIEIYIANKDNEIESAKRGDDDKIKELGREFQIQNLYSIGSGDVKGTKGDFDNKGGQYFDKEVGESFSCRLPSLQIKLERHQDKCDDRVSTERDIDEAFPKEIRVENSGISNECDSEKKCSISNEDDEVDSRHSEMEWEEGEISLVQLDTEGSCVVTTSNKSDSNDQPPLSEGKQTEFHQESTIMFGQSVRMSNEKMKAEEILQEESTSIDMHSNDYSDYDTEAYQKWEILELFPTEETCKESLAMEEQVEENESDLIDSVVKSTPKEKIAEETMDATAEVEENIDPQTEVEILDIACDTKVTTEVFHRQQEDEIVSERSNKIDPNSEQEVSVSESGFGREDESETDDDSTLMRGISEETPGPNACSQCNIADFDVYVLLEEDIGEHNGKSSSITGLIERVVSEIKTESTDNNTKDSIESELKSLYTRNKTSQEHHDASNSIKWTVRSKGHIDELEEEGRFNPRGPNFLPEVPEPEEEKVDLKHQMMDDKRNAEEWMLDFALQQAVTKLGPARKRKVALLVEAFETVIPVPKYESAMSYISPAFGPKRSIQACN